LQFFSIGFLLEIYAIWNPDIAGIAAAVTGFISTIMAVPISIFIGRFISDTALPLFVGFSICVFGSQLIYLKISEDDQYKFLKLNAENSKGLNK
jgi:DHA1 family bicyclomycin/chloramphenicol resistance-like MFS transporter